MRARFPLLLVGVFGLACTGGVDSPPPPPIEPVTAAVPEVSASPPAAPEAPSPDVAKPTPKPRPKPAQPAEPARPKGPAPAVVTIEGDAKSVWLLADGPGDKYTGGEVPPGPYKIKAWFKDPVPVIAANFTLEPGEVVVIRCEAATKRCEKSH